MLKCGNMMNCRILEDKRTLKILPIALPYLSTSSTNLLPKFILSVASAEALQHRQLQEAETQAEGPVLSSLLRYAPMKLTGLQDAWIKPTDLSCRFLMIVIVMI